MSISEWGADILHYPAGERDLVDTENFVCDTLTCQFKHRLRHTQLGQARQTRQSPPRIIWGSLNYL